MKEKHVFLSQSAYALFFRVMSAGMSYGLYLAIPLFFGAEALGIFVLFQTLLGALGVVLTLGLNLGLLKYVARQEFHRAIGKLYIQSVALSLGLSLLVAAIVWYKASDIASWFAAFSGNEMPVRLLALILPLQSLLLINVEVIRGMHLIRVSELYRSLIAYLGALMVLLLAFAQDHWTNVTAVWAFLFGTALAATGSTLFIVRKIREAALSKDQTATVSPSLKALLATSLPMLGSALVQNWNSRVMTLMLGVFASVETVGVFGLAFKLSTLPEFFISAVKAPTAPMISRYFKEQEWRSLRKLLQTSVRIIVLLMLPVGGLLFIFSKDLLALTGPDFISGVSALRILLISALISSFFGLTGAFLNMSDNQTVLFKSVLLGFLVNVLICWLIIPRYEANGVAFAFLVSTTLWNVLSSIFIYRQYAFATFPFPITVLKQLHPKRYSR